jgi:hypothetical protein
MMRAVAGLEDFTLATFTPLVGQQFQVLVDDGVTIGVVLVEATEPPLDREPSGARMPFSIVFRGPLDPLLPQRIYGLSHDDLGSFDLFIVPIGQDEEGTRYEAVFT